MPLLILFGGSRRALASNGGFPLVSGRPMKLLQVRVLRDLLHQFPVGELVFLLDDEQSHRHTEGLGNIAGPAPEELWRISFFELIPWDAVGKLYPAVVRIHVESHWLVEIQKVLLCSVSAFIHDFRLHQVSFLWVGCKDSGSKFLYPCTYFTANRL